MGTRRESIACVLKGISCRYSEEPPFSEIRVTGAILHAKILRRRFSVTLHGFGLFGKDPQALGKIIRIGASVYEVRAVLPPEYQMAMPADIWLATSRPKIVNRGNRDGKIYARLAPGNSVAAANAWLAPVAASLQKQAPKTNEGVTFESRLLRDSLMGDSKLLLYLLMSGAAIVLCVAYFNVYQLLAAEAALASSRWGIRIALGASRKRLFRDMLQEPLRLSLAGCTLGLLLSIGGMQMLRDLSSAQIPRIGDTRLIWQVALALFVLSTAAAGLFTVLMFFRTVAFEVDILGALRGGGQHGTSIRHALSVKRQVVLVAQITLSTALLISTGMVALALREAVSSRLGFYPEGVLVTDLDLKEPANTAAGSQYVRDLMQRLSLSSGVETAAATSSVPFEGNSYTATFNANDTGGGRELQFAAVSPEFFHTMGITVLRGRTFSGLDSKDSPRVAILNQAAAQTLFGVGQSLNREMKGDVGMGHVDYAGHRLSGEYPARPHYDCCSSNCVWAVAGQSGRQFHFAPCSRRFSHWSRNQVSDLDCESKSDCADVTRLADLIDAKPSSYPLHGVPHDAFCGYDYAAFRNGNL